MVMNEEVSVFHEGEQAIQERTGVKDQIGPRAQEFIRTYMPDQHREFFTALPHIYAGLVDDTGQPWATVGFGKSGFITSPDAEHLSINAKFTLQDELNLRCTVGSKVGLLGLDPTNRRRNRMNGAVESNNDETVVVAVQQSYGNCPQYIQTYSSSTANKEDSPSVLARESCMSAEMHGIVKDARTFFIASRAATLSAESRHGIDASHRGGKPGFVNALSDSQLVFPDFSGNRFYNTLGNISQDARVGLLFPHYSTGSLLFISGQARVIWKDDADYDFKGAERFIEVDISQVVLAENGLPCQSQLVEESPWLRRTGQWL